MRSLGTRDQGCDTIVTLWIAFYGCGKSQASRVGYW